VRCPPRPSGKRWLSKCRHEREGNERVVNVSHEGKRDEDDLAAAAVAFAVAVAAVRSRLNFH